jgi:hypothetical protein
VHHVRFLKLLLTRMNSQFQGFFYHILMLPIYMAVGPAGSVEFIQTLNRQIRKHLGMQEDSEDDTLKQIILPVKPDFTNKGILSPKSIVGALVQHHQSRLHNAVPNYQNDDVSSTNRAVPVRLALHEDYADVDVNDSGFGKK